MKVAKEELGGLLAAIERYLKVDHAAEQRELEGRVESIRTALKNIDGVQTQRHVRRRMSSSSGTRRREA